MLNSLRIKLTIFFVFLKRRLISFFSNPFKLNPIRVTILLSLVLLLLGVIIYTNFKDEILKPTLAEGVVGVYREGDLPPEINNLLSSGLYKAGPNGQIEANLAESITSNPEGTLYTIKLRENLFWVDKTKLVSTDLKSDFGGAQVSYLDERTIEFKLAEPFSPFPSLLTQPVYKTDSMVGTGPYTLSSIQEFSREGYVVKKLSLESSKKELPDLVVYLYPTEDLAKKALQLGEIKAVIGASDLPFYHSQNIFKTFSKTNHQQIVTIFYNTKDPILSDTNFRLALSFAAPVIQGQTEAKTSLPQTSWAYNADVKDFLNNPAQAKTYLQRVEKGKDEVITLTAVNNLADVGQEVVKAWQTQGVKAQLRIESGLPQNFQALLITQNFPVDPDQYAFWHSTQTQTNISQISNPRIDKDLEDGRRIVDLEKRKQAYLDFQKTLLDQAPATFLYFPKINVVYNRKVESDLMKVLEIQLGQH